MKKYLMGMGLVMMLIMGSLATTINAAEIAWKPKNFRHYSKNEDIKIILADFFASQGIGMICSKSVDGKISGNFVEKDPGHFFLHMIDAYNLIWYYDGAAVYLYSAHEVTSRILNLRYLDVKEFKENLNHLGILDSKFALKIIEKERIVYVSGPERYVSLVSEAAAELDAKAKSQRGSKDVIKVFKMKYSWAEDKTFKFKDNEVTLPGVATLLRNLITGNTAPKAVDKKKVVVINQALSKLKGKGLGKNRKSENENRNKENKEPSNKETSGNHQADIGFVQADARQNAVIVRDRKEKMPYYEEIISLLDIPVGMVEIRATIMDIDRNNMKDLGIEWEFADTFDDGVVKGGINKSKGSALPIPVNGGLSVATLLSNSTGYFLTKVHALEKKGHAKILSRPSVLTLNNLEAQLEHSKTFYVRVAGNEEVDLFDISAGVVLRVTPHVIEDNGKTLVKLAIQIEDGEVSQGNDRVDKIPVVKKSIINTQAVVNQKESLLIGGYLKENSSQSTSQVPCLGSIPFFGKLFQKNTIVKEKTERLFLITPTIVPYSGNAPMDLKAKGIIQ